MKNIKYIAICSNIPVFWENKISDFDWCKKFPGASWMPVLVALAAKDDFEVVSGDIALMKIKNKHWKANEVVVVQELNAKHGLQLLSKGSIGGILTACESPLFSYYFYDNVEKIASKFEYRKLFKGTFDYINSFGINIDMNFPSYHQNNLTDIVPWDEKKFMVMVAANKNGFSPMPKDSFKNQIIWLIHRSYKFFSNSFKKAFSHQLHITRLKLIEYFAEKKSLKLYGSNWLNKDMYTENEVVKIFDLISSLNPGFCDDKIETISKYKFTICFENISYKGYVTEKIIDCFVAGTIPIYLGADDITDFIPANCFIDYRSFENLDELDQYLQNIDKNKAIEIIQNGRNFIEGKEGEKFSFEYFSNEILNNIKEIRNNEK